MEKEKRWLKSEEFYSKFERKKILDSINRYQSHRRQFEEELPPRIKSNASQIKIFIVHDGKNYPAKAIAAHAYSHLIGLDETFQSGKRLKKYLQREKFHVIDNKENPQEFLAAKIDANIERERDALENENYFDFDSGEDSRRKRNRAIAIREGQLRFRHALLQQFNHRCVITDCDAVEALEAAHIVPYSGKNTNIIPNGLLLRADIHTLFDKKLITIDHKTMKVHIADQLKKTFYGILEGKTIKLQDIWKPYLEKRNNYDS